MVELSAAPARIRLSWSRTRTVSFSRFTSSASAGVCFRVANGSAAATGERMSTRSPRESPTLARTQRRLTTPGMFQPSTSRTAAVVPDVSPAAPMRASTDQKASASAASVADGPAVASCAHNSSWQTCAALGPPWPSKTPKTPTPRGDCTVVVKSSPLSVAAEVPTSGEGVAGRRGGGVSAVGGSGGGASASTSTTAIGAAESILYPDAGLLQRVPRALERSAPRPAPLRTFQWYFWVRPHACLRWANRCRQRW